MEREMASTAPISQPDQYMMVTTRQTTPAQRSQRGMSSKLQTLTEDQPQPVQLH